MGQNKQQKAAAARAKGDKVQPTSNATITETKPAKAATAAELRRAAATLRGLGNEDGAKALEAQAASMQPAKEAKPKAEPRPQCKGTKKNGEACTARAKEGSLMCVDHTPAWERLDAVEQGEMTHWWKAQTAQTITNLLGWHEAKRLIHEQSGS